jgi:hypothetical protein
MTALVKIFYHQGISQVPFASGSKYATDSVGTLKQPYIERASVSVDNVTAQSVTAAPPGSGVALVQVEQGKVVFCEVNPPNRSTSADSSSMSIQGDVTFVVGSGWSFSFLEDV